MNEWMDGLMNACMKYGINALVNEWDFKRINYSWRVNEWFNEWIKTSLNQFLNEAMKQDDLMNEWLLEWMVKCNLRNRRMSERMTKSLPDWHINVLLVKRSLLMAFPLLEPDPGQLLGKTRWP